jgi:hypothetical protein
MTACVVQDGTMSCFATACSDPNSMFKWITMLSEHGVKCYIMQELRAMPIMLVNFVTYCDKLEQHVAKTKHAVRLILTPC